MVPSSNSKGEDRRKVDPAGISRDKCGKPSPTMSKPLPVPEIGCQGAKEGLGRKSKEVIRIKVTDFGIHFHLPGICDTLINFKKKF